MVDAGAEVGDQLELWSSRLDDLCIDAIGHGRGEDVGPPDSVDERRCAHRPVLQIQLRIKQLPHPRLDRIGKFAGDDDLRFSYGH